MSGKAEQLAAWFRARGYYARPQVFVGADGRNPDSVFVSRAPVYTPAGPFGLTPVLENAFFVVPHGAGWIIVVHPHGGGDEHFEFEALEEMLDAAAA